MCSCPNSWGRDIRSQLPQSALHRFSCRNHFFSSFQNMHNYKSPSLAVAQKWQENLWSCKETSFISFYIIVKAACCISCHTFPSYSRREYAVLGKQSRKGQTAERWPESMIFVQWKHWALGHLLFSPNWKMLLARGERSCLAVRPMALPWLQEGHQASLLLELP